MTLSIDRPVTYQETETYRRDIAEEIEGLPAPERFDTRQNTVERSMAAKALSVRVELQHPDNPVVQLGDIR